MTLKGIYQNKSSKFNLLLLILLIISSLTAHLLIANGVVLLLFKNGLTLLSNQDLTIPATVSALKIIQAFTTTGLFITPILLFSHLTSFDLKLFAPTPRSAILIILAIIFLVNPIINYSYEWNQGFSFPQWMLEYDMRAEKITNSFLQMDSFNHLALNILVMALVPALGEEIFFRGFLQTKMSSWLQNRHLAIFITAIIFSAIHMQFQGLAPRFLLGLLLGYYFYWSGSLLLPIIAHFLNNGIVVLSFYTGFNNLSEFSLKSPSFQELFFSIIAVSLLLYLLFKSLERRERN